MTSDDGKVIFLKINLEDCDDWPQNYYGVYDKCFPTFLYFKDKVKLHKSMDPNKLKQLVKKYVS